MDIEIQALHIYTSDIISYSNFITTIFDIEVMTINEGSAEFIIGSQRVLLIENKDFTRQHDAPLMTLNLNESDDLYDLQNKIEFYFFREEVSADKVIIKEDHMYSFIELRDPSHQVWRIQTVSANYLRKQQVKENVISSQLN